MATVEEIIAEKCGHCWCKDNCPTRVIADDGSLFCNEEDAIGLGYYKCHECGEYTYRPNFIRSIGYVCSNCLYDSDKYEVCDCCGQFVPKETRNTTVVETATKHNEIKKHICNNCLEKIKYHHKVGNLVRCKKCGKLLWYTGSRSAARYINEEFYCSECSKDIHVCEACGAQTDIEFVHPFTGCKLCLRCYEGASRNYEDNLIRSWHTSKSNNNYSFLLGSGEDKYSVKTYGIELEVDAPSSVTTKFTDENKHWWRRGFLAAYVNNIRLSDNKPLFYTEKDSSVPSGLELISQPFSRNGYNNMRAHLMELLKVCKDKGFRSGTGTGCGLHIHVSKKELGSLALAKLIVLSSRMIDSIRKVSRRYDDEAIKLWDEELYINHDIYSNGGYANYFDLEESFGNNKDWKGNSIDKLIAIILDEKSLMTNQNFRHSAINICNKNTVEFRFFKGTLNIQYIDAALDFVDFFCDLANKLTAEEVFTITNAEFMQAAKDYSPLLSDYIDFVTAPNFDEVCEAVKKYNTWRIKESDLDITAKKSVFGEDTLTLSCSDKAIKNNN